MEDKKKLSRRDFLRLSAIGAASAMVVACGGQAGTQQAGGTAAPAGGAGTGATTAAGGAGTSATTAAGTLGGAPGTPAPSEAAGGIGATQMTGAGGTAEALKAPGKYQESPLLTDMVKAGKLPPVEQRLPKNPYVVPHKWVQPGKYGGDMKFSNSWGGNGVSNIVLETMYGHSPMRWLKDGLEIGPGWVETWEKNADASQWTFHIREGIKWSDGQPFTSDDVMYWWNDMVLNKDYTAEAVPPDEGKSGKGTLAQFKAVDANTLQIIFDAPSPLMADRMAMWVNAGNGPRWVAPKHYLKQFHPKYNSSAKDYKNHDQKMDMRLNPDVPVLTGWKLKEYKEGTASVWERNPYYWAVDKQGNQLPYIDTIHVTGYQDKEVEKVNYLAGKVDFGHHWLMKLTDVQAAKQAEANGKFKIRYRDSGSGSRSTAFFFSYDYQPEAMRKLIREPKFRQAMSIAINRPQIQKDFYFNTGEQTTGTMSPKAIEYNINDTGKAAYKSWRDLAVKYDPEGAKKMLDEIGVKAGAGGVRTMPDGGKLTVELIYDSATDKGVIATNERLAADWKAIGIDAKLVPVPSSGRGDKWRAGQLMSNADWGIGDGPNHLVYPQWVVPLEQTRWAPLEGTWATFRGTPKEKEETDVDPYKRHPPRANADPGGPVDKLWKIYDQTKVEPDFMKRTQLVWELIKIHVQYGPFVQGTVANYPNPIMVKNGLMNVPQPEDLALHGFTDPWIHPTPAVYDPESWFWNNLA